MKAIKTLGNIITALAITLSVASCNTLRIAMDNTTHGERVIVTTDSELFEYEGATISAALGEKISGNDTLMGVLVVFDSNINHPVFEVGDKMTFTLNDNTNVTLTNLYDREFESETTTSVTERPVTTFEYAYCYDPIYGPVYLTPGSVTHFVPEVTVRNVRRSYALYPISKTDLQKIVSKGVTGVTVESDFADMSSKHTEEYQGLFAEMWGLLRAEVKANLDNKPQ